MIPEFIVIRNFFLYMKFNFINILSFIYCILIQIYRNVGVELEIFLCDKNNYCHFSKLAQLPKMYQEISLKIIRRFEIKQIIFHRLFLNHSFVIRLHLMILE